MPSFVRAHIAYSSHMSEELGAPKIFGFNPLFAADKGGGGKGPESPRRKKSGAPRKSGQKERSERKLHAQNAAQSTSASFHAPQEKKRRKRNEKESAARKTPGFFVWAKSEQGRAPRIAEIIVRPGKAGKLDIRRTEVSTYLRNIGANQDRMIALRNGFKGQMIVDFRTLAKTLRDLSAGRQDSRALIVERIADILERNTESEAQGAGSADEQAFREKKLFSLWLFLASNGYVPNPNLSQRTRTVGDYRFDHALIAQFNTIGREIEVLKTSYREASTQGHADKFFFPAGLVEYVANSESFAQDGFTRSEVQRILASGADVPFVPKAFPKRSTAERPPSAKPAARPSAESQVQEREEAERKLSADFQRALTELSTILGVCKQVEEAGLIEEDPSAKVELDRLKKRIQESINRAATITSSGPEDRKRIMRSIIDIHRSIEADFNRLTQ